MLEFEKAIWADWLDKYSKKELTHALDEYSDRRATIAKLALKLLKIFEYEISENKIYINTKNAKRFLRLFDSNNILDITELRCTKAWHLYNLLREYKLQEMWD